MRNLLKIVYLTQFNSVAGSIDYSLNRSPSNFHEDHLMHFFLFYIFQVIQYKKLIL